MTLAKNKPTRGWFLRFFIRLVVCLLVTGNLAAQEIPNMVNYTKSAYGGQNQNWSIAQAPWGYIYIGNASGLMEFDGAHWTRYPLPLHQTIRSVYCDPSGRIYTGAYGEFGYWQYDVKGILTYHSLISQLSKSVQLALRSEEIWHIQPVGEGIFFQSFARMYGYFHGKVNQIMPPGNIMFMYPAHHRYFIQVLDQGIFEFTSGHFQFLAGSKRFSRTTVSSILPYRSSGLLISTIDEGLFIYHHQVFSSWKGPLNQVMKKEQVNKAILLPRARMAFGTISNGIYITDLAGNILDHFNRKNGLVNNTVLSLFTDREGNLWSGLDNGLTMIHLQNPVRFYFSKEGALGTVYAATLFAHKLLIGTNTGVYYKSWNGQATAGDVDFTLIQGTQGQVWDLQRDKNQVLLGHNKGTYLIDSRFRLRRISSVTGGWSFRLIPGDSMTAYQATYTGIIAYQKLRGLWTFKRRIPGFSAPVRKLIVLDANNLLCQDPYQGVYYLHLNERADSVNLVYKLGPKDGISKGTSLELEALGKDVFIRTESAVSRVLVDHRAIRLMPDSSKTEEATKEGYTLEKGLGEEYFKVYPNRTMLYTPWLRSQNMDFSANNRPGDPGPICLPLKLNTTYTQIFRLDTAHYLFCMDDGYGILNRKDYSMARQARYNPLMFRKVEVIGRIPKTYYFKPDERKTSKIVLLPNENQFKVSYAWVGYTQTPLYRYRIIGLGDRWSGWQEQSAQEFINLNPGSYRFEIQSDISEEVTKLVVIKKAYWYATTLAYGLYALMIFIGIGASFQIHQHRIVRRQRGIYEKKVATLKNQKLLLEQKIMRVQNEKLQDEIARKNLELSNTAFSLIRKNEILKEIKEEVDLTRAELGSQVPTQHFRKIMRYIDSSLSSEKDWVLFEKNFNEVHDEFFRAIKNKHPTISPTELKLAACLRMNLSSKEISPIMNITVRGVEIKRYRLRKKLGIAEQINLAEYLMAV